MSLGFDALSEDPLSALPATGASPVSLSSATTDGADVLAGNLAPIIATSLTTTDGADTLAGAIGVTVETVSNTTDGADVFAGVIGVSVDCLTAANDGADTFASNVDTGGGSVNLSVEVTDGVDVSSALITLVSSAPSTGSGGGYSPTYTYLSYTYEDALEDERLEAERKKTVHAPIVKQAAEQAVSNNYYAAQKKQNEEALNALKQLSLAMKFEISLVERRLLKKEVERLRIIREATNRQEEEEFLMMM